jgi:hypothetical protein
MIIASRSKCKLVLDDGTACAGELHREVGVYEVVGSDEFVDVDVDVDEVEFLRTILLLVVCFVWYPRSVWKVVVWWDWAGVYILLLLRKNIALSWFWMVVVGVVG